MSLIPSTDLTEFMLLPADVRRDIDLWNTHFTTVHKPIVASLEAVAARLGSNFKTASRKYYAWRRDGWRALINRARLPQDRSHSPEFIEWWKSLCLQYQRKFAPAYREFVRRFRAGEAIPGIDPCVPRGTMPTGFGYDNLLRFKPTKFETLAGRIGRSAAAACRPKVITTRVGLEVGQRIIFDDMWHDFEVVMIGQRSSRRLLQLHAHDLLSACQFARGLKARIKNDDGKAENLTQDEMLFLLAHVLGEFGFHPDGTVLMVEHGTAAIAQALEELIFSITAGKVTVDRSGIEGVSSFAGQYAGRSKGNFRFKASLESLGNLIHNETSNLLAFPGQTGSNSRTNLPEELHGRKVHADSVLMAMVTLPPDVVAKLALPFVEVNTAKWAVNEVMERINRRTEHDLEGWLQLGFTTVDMEIPGVGLLPASAYIALPPEKRAAVDAVATPAPRKLSPREVFDAGRSRLVKFRPEQVAALLKDTVGQERPVGDDHLITIENEAVSPEPISYLAHHFAPGDKFRCVVNPWSPELCHLFDARGAWVGHIKAWQAVSHLDPDGLHRQMGAAAKIERQLLAPLARRGAAITRQRLANSQANIDTLKAHANHQADPDFIKHAGPAAADAILAPSSPSTHNDEIAADILLSALSASEPSDS